MEAIRNPRTDGKGPRSLGRLDGTHVLVVDDTPDSRDLMERLLIHSGATVRTAAGADEALEALEQEPFDVVVTDIGMPGSDGFTLLARMRARASRYSDVAVIAVTGYAGEDFRARCLTAGFRAHLPKPVELELLLRAIESTLHADPPARGTMLPFDGSRAASA